MILELSVASVKKLVSVDLKPHSNRDTHGVIARNVVKYNTHGAMFHQVTGNSRSKETIARVQSLFPTQHSVDFFFIDGDHVDCAPDFHLYRSLVRPGGVIMFDDYHDRRVKKSVKTIHTTMCFDC